MSIRKNKYIIIELISCFFILQELESESDQSKLFWLVIVRCQSVSQSVSQSVKSVSQHLLTKHLWNYWVKFNETLREASLHDSTKLQQSTQIEQQQHNV